MKLYLHNIVLASSILLATTASAQNILIKDDTGKVINNDTVYAYPEFTQKPPYTMIHCNFKVQNTGAATITTRAKKTELSLTPGAEHAICYAGLCYTSNIFVSSLTVTLAPTQSDSTLAGSYRYLAPSITPNDLVAYTVFDENDTTDSATVYVRYLHAKPTSVQTQAQPVSSVNTYPNPANDVISFNIKASGSGTLYIMNSVGQLIAKRELIRHNTTIINTAQWQPGVYYYSYHNDGSSAMGSFAVAH